MSVNLLVLQNLFQERDYGTSLTPDGMLKGIAYTYKRKHKCSILLIVNFADLQVRTVSQCFSCYAFISLESECKITKNT